MEFNPVNAKLTIKEIAKRWGVTTDEVKEVLCDEYENRDSVGKCLPCVYKGRLAKVNNLSFVDTVPDFCWLEDVLEFERKNTEKNKIEAKKQPKCCTESGDINKKTENKMLEMLLAMAMDKYKYDPEAEGRGVRQKATGKKAGSISASAESVGLFVDPQTARKYLDEAYDLLKEKLK